LTAEDSEDFTRPSCIRLASCFSLLPVPRTPSLLTHVLAAVLGRAAHTHAQQSAVSLASPATFWTPSSACFSCSCVVYGGVDNPVAGPRKYTTLTTSRQMSMNDDDQSLPSTPERSPWGIRREGLWAKKEVTGSPEEDEKAHPQRGVAAANDDHKNTLPVVGKYI